MSTPIFKSIITALGIAIGALALSLVFHTPSLWMFAEPHPGSTQWDRGLEFREQCESPIGSEQVAVALVWRMAPALLAKALGLHGMAVFIIPWLGLLIMLTLCAALILKRTSNLWMAAIFTSIIATTSSTLTVTGWLGLNDAWYASALISIACIRSWPTLILAALIGPWIDEKFILALPLALYVRSQILGSNWRPRSSLIISALGVGTYAVIRLFNLPHFPIDAVEGYLGFAVFNFYTWLPWAGLGWFMGLRAAWFLIVFSIGGNCQRGDLRNALWPAALALAPLVVITVVAADTGRAPTMLLPLIFLAVDRLIENYGATRTRRILAYILVANLLLPAMHVTYKKTSIINSLPIEIARWYRQ